MSKLQYVGNTNPRIDVPCDKNTRKHKRTMFTGYSNGKHRHNIQNENADCKYRRLTQTERYRRKVRVAIQVEQPPDEGSPKQYRMAEVRRSYK